MTQSSRPQADNVANLYLDAGPYSRDQWAKKLIIEQVGDAVTTRGPFAKYLNRLEVTNPAGATIQVDTGAGYCNGSLLDNTAAVTFTATAPAANPRIDTVCIVENNTNAAVSNGTAANGWIFPTVLVDYENLSSIPAYSARLVIVKGAEAAGPVAPALDQSSALYMIPLGQYQISIVPVVSALTDERDYVDAETKYLWAQPEYAYNTTDGAAIIPTRTAAYVEYAFPDNKDCLASAHAIVPQDYIEAMYVYSVFLGAAAGTPDIVLTVGQLTAPCGDTPAGTADGPTAWTMLTGATVRDCLAPLLVTHPVTPPGPGYIMDIQTDRIGTAGADTLNATAYFLGWKIEYLGYR